MVALVVLMLATVTFDGFGATSAWVDVQSESLDIFVGVVNTTVVNGITIADTLGTPAVSHCLPAGLSGLLRAHGPGRGQCAPPRGNWLGPSSFSLCFPLPWPTTSPHFFTLLVVQGQLLIPLSSDPLGLGWDLFGDGGLRSST